MVNGDDGQPWSVTLHGDLYRGLVKCGVDVVDGDRVVWVGCVAAHIADYAQLAVGRLKALLADKGWDGFGEVDAVDEDVGLDDLGVRAIALLGLWQIPLLDLGAANLLE